MRKQLIFGPVRNVSDSGSVRLPGIKGLACSEEKIIRQESQGKKR